jgi:alpha-L-fucosidase
MKIPALLLTAFALACVAVAQTPPAAPAATTGQAPVKPDDAAQQDRMAWFKRAHFGMFIHWGLYSLPAGQWPGRTYKPGRTAGEWIMMQENLTSAEYEPLAAQFNPVKFDAKAWVALAKAAGMKYLIITAKHHDGFSMFATKQSPYNIVDATPFKRDPLKELADACHEAGIVFCVYYSIADWHNPDFPAQYATRAFYPGTTQEDPTRGFSGAPKPDADISKYDDYMQAQVRELLTGYGPIGVVWFDGGGTFKGLNRGKLLNGEALVQMIHQLQPATLINERLGVGADYTTPEQAIPDGKAVKPFEVCMTLNQHWSYNKFDTDWKTPATVVRNIADIVSKGGNYLINVGPTAEGEIPAQSVRILQEVGTWTATNAEAIYGAGPTPFGDELGYRDPEKKDRAGKPRWVDRDEWRCTTQPGKLYFTLLKWPGAAFTLPPFSNEITRAYLLADAQRTPLKVATGATGTTVALPAEPPAKLAPVLCIEIEGTIQPAETKARPDTAKDPAS